VVIKSLEDALRDGDPIRAIIRNSVVSSDGRTPGIIMPSSNAQEGIIRKAYGQAGLDPIDTCYVEAHGTGSLAGDPIEAGAIAATFGKSRPVTKPLYVGTIKTNIGHLESASGIAGFIKAVLVLEKGYIPPHINYEKPHENLSLDEWNIKVRD
jgi:acyl transferase domain-containing protein